FTQTEFLTVRWTTNGATVNVLAAAIPISINGSISSDTIGIGDGNLDSFTSPVNISGGGGTDLITFNDQRNTRSDNYTFTSSGSRTFSRPGMQTITFSASSVKLLAGSGNNLINLPGSIASFQTIIDAGDGDDTINMS